MDLKDLMTRLQAIEENAPTVAPVHTDGPATEEMMGISLPMPGMMGMGHEEPPKQPDNVTMNVSLNGSGSGGVKDLMKILRDIEDGPATTVGHDDDEPLIGDMVAHMAHEEEQGPEESMEEVQDDVGETWANSVNGDAGAHTHGVDAVTFSGDDMNSKGKLSPLARAPGTNAMRHPMHESLVDKLTAMYETIKENAHHDDEEKKIRHLMRKYGWSRQEALEYYHYEEHDPKDYEDMEEGVLDELSPQLMKRAVTKADTMMNKNYYDDNHNATYDYANQGSRIQHGIDKRAGKPTEYKKADAYIKSEPGANTAKGHRMPVGMEEGAFKDKDTDRKEKAYAAKQTLKHIKNPTKGEKDAAKDIKPGSYKDRADLLKSAEADGRLDESVSQMLALNKRLNG